MRFLAVIVALLALAGCGGGAGGDSDEGYAQGLVSALGGVAQPTSLDSGSLAGLAKDYGRAAERLGGLTPPAEIAESHGRMVASMRAYADALERASKLTGNPAQFTSEMTRGQADAQAWTSAFEDIRARGYATVSAS
jgi:hypothetical protein